MIERTTHDPFCPVTMHGADATCACPYIEGALVAERQRMQERIGQAIWNDEPPTGEWGRASQQAFVESRTAKTHIRSTEPKGLGAVAFASTSVHKERRLFYRDHLDRWVDFKMGAIRVWDDLIYPVVLNEGYVPLPDMPTSVFPAQAGEATVPLDDPALHWPD